MKNSKLVRTATVALFSLLLIIFVAYRSGVFEKIYPDRSTVFNTDAVASSIAPDYRSGEDLISDSLVMLASSSKSTAILEPRYSQSEYNPAVPPLLQDTTSQEKKKFIMPSSKSAPVWDSPRQQQDTAMKRTTKNQKPAPDTTKKQSKRTIMGGSKSGFIYDPTDTTNDF